MSRDCAVWCVSSRHPAAFPAMSACRPPVRSMKAASWDTRWCTRLAPRSTIPTCSSPASSATARPRPAPSKGRGRACASSTPHATAPSFPSCISTRTRSLGRRCSAARPTATCAACCTRTAMRSSRLPATTRHPSTVISPRRSTVATPASEPSRMTLGSGASRSGRDGPPSCCALRRAGPGRRSSTVCASKAHGARTRCRSPTRGRTRPIWNSWKRGCAHTTRKRSSTPVGDW